MSTGLMTREPYGIVRRWGGGGSYPVPFTSGMGWGGRLIAARRLRGDKLRKKNGGIMRKSNLDERGHDHGGMIDLSRPSSSPESRSGRGLWGRRMRLPV